MLQHVIKELCILELCISESGCIFNNNIYILDDHLPFCVSTTHSVCNKAIYEARQQYLDPFKTFGMSIQVKFTINDVLNHIRIEFEKVKI